jgi:TRAP-type mannitol/chloroaromatic compound transport system substrate-binding protein
MSLEVMAELAAADENVGRVYASYRAYADAIGVWHDLAEGSHTGIRRA